MSNIAAAYVLSYLLYRKEEIFNEASKALKHQLSNVEHDVSSGVSDAKKLKTTADESMPSFCDMMAYIQNKVKSTDSLVTS